MAVKAAGERDGEAAAGVTVKAAGERDGEIGGESDGENSRRK
ncbi:MAG: hypothetical protein OXU88_08990 [Gammaproteobacteria bacterium]|nr:hypothetical protein [Gammaproteobacteria bacterium]